MERELIFQKLQQHIGEQLNVDEELVTEDANLVDDLGADSLDLVELLMSVEEEFGLSIPDEEAESVGTRVGDAVDYLVAQL